MVLKNKLAYVFSKINTPACLPDWYLGTDLKDCFFFLFFKKDHSFLPFQLMYLMTRDIEICSKECSLMFMFGGKKSVL